MIRYPPIRVNIDHVHQPPLPVIEAMHTRNEVERDRSARIQLETGVFIILTDVITTGNGFNQDIMTLRARNPDLTQPAFKEGCLQGILVPVIREG